MVTERLSIQAMPAKRRGLMALLFLLGTFFYGMEPLQAQSGSTYLAGQANDEKGMPLPGVTVLVKGTAAGTITDGEGRYRLDSPRNREPFSFPSSEC